MITFGACSSLHQTFMRWGYPHFYTGGHEFRKVKRVPKETQHVSGGARMQDITIQTASCLQGNKKPELTGCACNSQGTRSPEAELEKDELQTCSGGLTGPGQVEVGSLR